MFIGWLAFMVNRISKQSNGCEVTRNPAEQRANAHTYKKKECKYTLSYLLCVYFHCFNLIGWRATSYSQKPTNSHTVCPESYTIHFSLYAIFLSIILLLFGCFSAVASLFCKQTIHLFRSNTTNTNTRREVNCMFRMLLLLFLCFFFRS